MQAPSGSSVDMARIIQAGAIAMRGKGCSSSVRRGIRATRIFPKGHVEPGESLAETACRELAEEAGIAGKAVREVGVSTFPRGRLLIEVTYFLVRFVGHVEPAEPREVRLAQPRRGENASPRSPMRSVCSTGSKSCAEHPAIPRFLRRIGWPAASCYVAAAVVLAVGYYSDTSTCLWRAVTGLPCPGCGMIARVPCARAR